MRPVRFTANEVGTDHSEPPSPFDIRTPSAVDRTGANLEELVVACRARGPLYCHDLASIDDVTRKAKGLSTSLAGLGAAMDDPHHQPPNEEPMTKGPPYLRLNFQAHLHELARFISYGGRREKDVEEKCAELRQQFGEEKVRAAMHELTMKDEATGLRVLNPYTRKLCRGLLGPAPEDEDYARYYEINRREPVAEHQPPGLEEEVAKPKKRGRGR